LMTFPLAATVGAAADPLSAVLSVPLPHADKISDSAISELASFPHLFTCFIV
jgi:hypothetical protein